MKIDNIYIKVRDFDPFYIDLTKYTTAEPLLTNNLRGRIKSVKEIKYKERHSRFNDPLQIEKESTRKFSVFGHDITDCDFEYDSYGQKIKCHFPSRKITSEYKHTYDQNGNCTETRCTENGILITISKNRFHEGLIKEESFTKMQGNKTVFQSRTEYDYLNGLLVEKKRLETKEKSMGLTSYNYYWYDENRRLIKESYWWTSPESWGLSEHGGNKWFSYDSKGRLTEFYDGTPITFIYSKTGHLFQMQYHDRLIEFDEKGNCISNDGKNRESLQQGFNYEYDSFGNWTKKTERRVTLIPDEVEREMNDLDVINMNAPRITLTERQIEYYS